ncbi:MAG: PDZ domain-containing protein, partial [Streptosporangiaceae bacterium]
RDPRLPAGNLGRNRDGPDPFGPGVTTGSPAYGAGVLPNDVIVSVGGRAVTSATSLRSVLDAYHPGDKAVLRWIDQAGQAHAATIVFTTGPAG